MFVFAGLLQEFAAQVAHITNVANSIQASLASADRVFEVLDAPLEITSPPIPNASLPSGVRSSLTV
jgi:ATP-binding cassette subfamily B protein